jgi:hypothetical protein
LAPPGMRCRDHVVLLLSPTHHKTFILNQAHNQYRIPLKPKSAPLCYLRHHIKQRTLNNLSTPVLLIANMLNTKYYSRKKTAREAPFYKGAPTFDVPESTSELRGRSDSTTEFLLPGCASKDGRYCEATWLKSPSIAANNFSRSLTA